MYELFQRRRRCVYKRLILRVLETQVVAHNAQVAELPGHSTISASAGPSECGDARGGVCKLVQPAPANPP